MLCYYDITIIVLTANTFFVIVNALKSVRRQTSTTQKNEVQDLHLHFHYVKVQHQNQRLKVLKRHDNRLKNPKPSLAL